MANAKSLGQLIQGHDSWIALTLFQSAQVLLAEARFGFDLFLGQALLAPDACEIAAYKLAHVHAHCVPAYVLCCYQL